MQTKNVLVGTFFALDQVVWLGRSGIYKVFSELLLTILFSILSRIVLY